MPDVSYSFDDVRRYHDEFTMENWDEDPGIMRYAFLRMPEFFTHALIQRDGPVAELMEAPREEIGQTTVRTPLGQMPLDEYVERGPVNGVVIVQRGAIVYERYPRMRRIDKHLLMSVSKVFASTLIAILEDRGLVDSREAAETYLPELRESGWEGVSVRDVLDMASGIDCDQEAPGVYTDPTTTYYRYEETLGWLPPAHPEMNTWEYLAGLGRARQPGQSFDYSSANTSILCWIAERVTGRFWPDLASEEIWSRIGAESDALITTSRHGVAAVHGGISARLRDVARFGLLFAPSRHVVCDAPIISGRYLREITHGGRPEIFDKGASGKRFIERLAPARPTHNAYQWDFVMPDGDFFKGGYGGQGLYISPTRDLVIAFAGSAEPGVESGMASIAQQVSVEC